MLFILETKTRQELKITIKNNCCFLQSRKQIKAMFLQVRNLERSILVTCKQKFCVFSKNQWYKSFSFKITALNSSALHKDCMIWEFRRAPCEGDLWYMCIVTNTPQLWNNTTWIWNDLFQSFLLKKTLQIFSTFIPWSSANSGIPDD